MGEKHLVETAGIDIDDWEQTPVSVRKVVVQLAGKVEQMKGKYLSIALIFDRLGPFICAITYFVVIISFVEFRSVFEIDYDEGYNLAKGSLIATGEPLFTRIWSDQPPLLALMVAGLQKVFPWSVTVCRLLILVLSSVMVGAIYASAGQILKTSGNVPVDRRSRILAGWSAAIAFVATERIVRMSLAVDVGTPSIVFATISLAFLIYQWSSPKPSIPVWLSGFFLALGCGAKLFVAFLIPIFIFFSSVSLLTNREAASPVTRTLLVVPSIWISGFLVGTLLIFLPVFSKEIPQQLLSLHLQARAAETPSIPESIYINDLPFYLLAFAGSIILLVTRKLRSLPAIVWLIAAVAVIYFHHPVQSSHRLLMVIPAAILVGAGIGALVDFRYRYKWYTLAIAGIMLIALGVFSGVRFLSPAHWRTGAEPSAFLTQAMSHLDGYEHSKMATSRQTLAFRAKMLTPPELAVTSMKRFSTGQIDVSDILKAIREQDVAFVFLDSRWPKHIIEPLFQGIRHDYCVVLNRKDSVMWKNRKIALPGECLYLKKIFE